MMEYSREGEEEKKHE